MSVVTKYSISGPKVVSKFKVISDTKVRSRSFESVAGMTKDLREQHLNNNQILSKRKTLNLSRYLPRMNDHSRYYKGFEGASVRQQLCID